MSGYIYIFAGKNVDFLKSNPYKPVIAYAESKLANILHAVELQRRYADQGIKAYSLHPGVIGSTELARERKPNQPVLMTLFAVLTKTIPQGAMTTLYCALSDEAQPGKYHSNCRVVHSSSAAYNSDKSQKLWELSEKILNEKAKCL